jgi:hypothetical protein
VKLTKKEKEKLLSLIVQKTAPQRDVMRARIADDDEPTVGARLTELGRHRYGAAFRTHNGRWEPLPGTGAIEEMADVVVTLLTPYLQPDS